MEKAKTNFTKAIITVLSIILAAVFAAALLPFSSEVNAHADPGDGSEAPVPPPVSPEEPDEYCDFLYYFSDYDGAEDFCGDFVYDIVNTYKQSKPEFELMYRPMQDMETLEALDFYLGADDGFYSIQNSIVIIEIRNTLEYNSRDDNNDIFDNLLDIFRTLKGADCQTMFICETDENLFGDKVEFLDYVDVHINTDLYLSFIQSALNLIDHGNGIDGTRLILDGIFATDWFSRLYLMKCLASKYNDLLLENASGEMADFETYLNSSKDYYFDCSFIFRVLNLTLYCRIGEKSFNKIYYDTESKQYIECIIDWGEFWFDCFEKNIKIGIFISTDWCEGDDEIIFTPDDDYFHNQIGSIQNNPHCECHTFVYTTSNYKYDFNFEYKPAGFQQNKLNYYIENIIRALVFDEDLEQYNNYDGRCVITFKPLFVGEDGWISSHIEDWDLMKVVDN